MLVDELPRAAWSAAVSPRQFWPKAERGVAHLKNWKVLKTGYRGRLTEFPDLLRTVTRLEIYLVWG